MGVAPNHLMDYHFTIETYGDLGIPHFRKSGQKKPCLPSSAITIFVDFYTFLSHGWFMTLLVENSFPPMGYHNPQ